MLSFFNDVGIDKGLVWIIVIEHITFNWIVNLKLIMSVRSKQILQVDH